MSNHRYSKFWWQDWQNDPALGLCCLAARGLWMDILAMAHAGTPCGHVTVNGKAATNRQIASLARCSEREVSKLIPELEGNGVFSRTDDGVIFSRRMVRDAERSEEGAANVLKRKDRSPPNSPPGNGSYKPPSYSIDQKHRSEAEAESSSDAGARGGAAPGKVLNLIFPDDPRPGPPRAVPPPDDRPAWGSTGHMLESTAKREPYGAVRSVDDQLAILRGEKTA